MKRIKVGIIGQGRSGRNIHRCLMMDIPEVWNRFEVVAISDPIKERWEYPAKMPISPKLKCYEDCHEMLKDKRIELIVNSSRTPGHVPLSIAAMEAGFNVLCEKPAATKLKDFDKAIAVAKKTGRFYNIFQQSRFRSVFEKVREIIDSGVLGRIVMAKIYYNCFARRWDWQTLQDMEGGELVNTGPHPLDQALTLYGDAYPERIFCAMDRAMTFGDAEDCIKLILAGKNHPVIDMEVFRNCAYPEASYQVYGTYGSLKGTAKEIYWKYFRPEDEAKYEPNAGILEGAGRLPCYCGEKLNMFEESFVYPDRDTNMVPWGTKYYLQMYDAITKGKPMDVTLEHVRRQIKVVDECRKQCPLDKHVTLKGERL